MKKYFFWYSQKECVRFLCTKRNDNREWVKEYRKTTLKVQNIFPKQNNNINMLSFVFLFSLFSSLIFVYFPSSCLWKTLPAANSLFDSFLKTCFSLGFSLSLVRLTHTPTCTSSRSFVYVHICSTLRMEKASPRRHRRPYAFRFGWMDGLVCIFVLCSSKY